MGVKGKKGKMRGEERGAQEKEGMNQNREDLSVINNFIFLQTAFGWSLCSNRILVPSG